MHVHHVLDDSGFAYEQPSELSSERSDQLTDQHSELTFWTSELVHEFNVLWFFISWYDLNLVPVLVKHSRAQVKHSTIIYLKILYLILNVQVSIQIFLTCTYLHMIEKFFLFFRLNITMISKIMIFSFERIWDNDSYYVLQFYLLFFPLNFSFVFNLYVRSMIKFNFLLSILKYILYIKKTTFFSTFLGMTFLSKNTINF